MPATRYQEDAGIGMAGINVVYNKQMSASSWYQVGIKLVRAFIKDHCKQTFQFKREVSEAA